jgi:CrcB protein
MPVLLAVALGGALGASARYSIDRLIEQRSFAVFPWSTFTINVSGCFLIGLVVAALVDRHHLPAWLRVGIAVGVLGGYTTFSTYAQETLGLFEAPISGSLRSMPSAAWPPASRRCTPEPSSDTGSSARTGVL